MCVHAFVCVHAGQNISCGKRKMYMQKARHFGSYFCFFPELLLFLLLAFNSTSPPCHPSLPCVSCLSSHSCIHTQSDTYTFRNFWPGRQSSFINFWVWVQYSVFLDSHLRAIINAGMLAEHPDLPAQICRHHSEGRTGTKPKQPTS